jgi:hypothetical protein
MPARRQPLKSPGSPPLAEKRDLYIDLMSKGVRTQRRVAFRRAHGHDLRTARGGGRSDHRRPLGGRSPDGQQEPLGHRHAGRADHALRDARAPPRRTQRRASQLGAHRDGRHYPGRPEAFADLGPGQRDGLPRRLHPCKRCSGLLLRSRQPLAASSNENTNGLLRQYFPKGTDLGVHSPEVLAVVAAELNDRPRETLGWETPAAHLRRLLQRPN